MTDNVEPGAEAENIPQATIQKRRGVSPVWIVPLVAAAVAGYLLFEHLTQAGPTITITFEQGDGISTTTTIRYRGVEVGGVHSVTLSEDLKNVVVKARLVGSAAGLASNGTKFWIVKPEITASGITGLSTIVSGAFITLEPGSGDRQTTFVGLKSPPDIPPGETGREFVLRGSTLHSATSGTPILYREVQVGEVIRTRLSDDQTGVDINILVDSEYVPLVRKNSIFYNASGIHADFSVFKATIDVESVSSLIRGGIAFANPITSADQAEAGSIFEVQDSPPPAYLIERDSKDLHIVLTADRKGAVIENDPIYYREFQVGQVSHVELSSDSLWIDVHVIIDEPYAPLVRSNSVFWNASGLHLTAGLFSGAKIDIESLQSLIAGGLAFATPDQAGPQAKDGTVFLLQPQGKDAWKTWAPHITISAPHAELASNPQRLGTDNETMRSLQEALKERGFYTEKVDGLYGPQTRTALLAYQRAEGLNETGLPDEATRAKLLP